MLDKIIGKISMRYCFILHIQVLQFRDIKWSFVFGVINEVAFCRLWHTSLFYFRQINVLIILNILTHRQNIRLVWK